jgi:NADH-quinone oxidoreductase subunit J
MDGVVNICWCSNGSPCDAGTTTGVGIGSERGRDDMSAAVFAFYLFATSALAGGLFTVISRNPVHSVLWLILSFLSSAGLFVLLGAEFIAMLLIIVYVGAVAVLFLFVVMMLDVDFAELKAEMAKYLPLGLLIGVVLMMQVTVAIGVWEMSDHAMAQRAAVIPQDTHNTVALGLLVYDDYFLLFQLAGLILLVAMIGAIVLTLRHRPDVKRQDVLAQMWRDPAKALSLKNVKPGEGL